MTTPGSDVLVVEGSGHQRGVQHGAAIAPAISACLATWAAGIEAECDAPADVVVGRFLEETSYVRDAGRYVPELMDEIRGIAAGSGLDVEMVVGLNFAEEEYTRRLGPSDVAPMGCTTVGLRTSVPLSGQNMDIYPREARSRALIRARGEADPEALVLSTAGLIGLCGVNDAGVSVFCNSLPQHRTADGGIPVALIVREVLRRRTLRDARAFVEGVPHATGENYLIGAPEGVVSLEASADGVREIRPEGRTVWHTNHPVDGRGRPNSHERDDFVEARIGAIDDLNGLRGLLADRTVPVCKVAREDHDEEGIAGNIETVWSILVKHSRPPAVEVCAGPPDRTEWQRIGFDASAPTAAAP